MGDNEEFSQILLPTDGLGKTLRALRRTTLSVHNRLASIAADAEFVQNVADAYGLPIIANERCGSWYVPPARRTASTYFKSTDGHANQWSFNTRRLNFHILDAIVDHGGCIIVDSTRRGKSMPDALSKTVPIWCATLNRFLLPENVECHQLYTPPKCVSLSEHAQIEQRMDRFLEQLRSLGISSSSFPAALDRPLRPLWVTRESSLPVDHPTFEDFFPVVLCTASRRVVQGDVAADGYIQGAGDDNEGWSKGLTAEMFWSNHAALLQCEDHKLDSQIQSLKESFLGASTDVASAPVLIKPTNWLHVSTDEVSLTRTMQSRWFMIHCGGDLSPGWQMLLENRYLHLKCRSGKLGSRDLRQELPKLKSIPFDKQTDVSIVCCSSNQDLAVGVALAAWCLRDLVAEDAHIDKDFIRRRLSKISISMPYARPLRTTLQSVNSFLMSSDG